MNPNCPRCGASGVIKYGRFYRAEDAQSIQRYRCILGFRVAQIPAYGLIARRSREKYGPRRNLSGYARRDLLKTLAPHIAPQATVTCDEHPRYRAELEAALTNVNVTQHRSVRGSLTGQGCLLYTSPSPRDRG